MTKLCITFHKDFQAPINPNARETFFPSAQNELQEMDQWDLMAKGQLSKCVELIEVNLVFSNQYVTSVICNCFFVCNLAL